MAEGSGADELINRCAKFAADVRILVRTLAKDVANIEDSKQLVRSSGSVGANYIEAQEALSKKDFVYRAKICRKEARESGYWLALIKISPEQEIERKRLRQEATELKLIFNAIANRAG